MDPQIPQGAPKGPIRGFIWPILGLFWVFSGLFWGLWELKGPILGNFRPILGSLGLSQEGKCGSTNSAVGPLGLLGLDFGLFGPILSLNRHIRDIWDWIWAVLGALSLDLGHFEGSCTYFRPILGSVGLPRRGNVDPQVPRCCLWAIQGLFWGNFRPILGHLKAYFRPILGLFRSILGSLGHPRRGNVDPQILRWDLWAIRGLFWAILGLIWAILGHSGPFWAI